MSESRPVFLVYSSTTSATIQVSLGEPEYSYYFVLKAYLPVLEELGEVVAIARPDEEVDEHYRRFRDLGRYCVFLAFCPPDQLNLELECPTIPVFAWEFENIPNESWGSDLRTDWRYSLGRVGWAITHSRHTVANVRRNIRTEFPIASAPAPLWDHYSANSHARRGTATDQTVALTVECGHLVDSQALDLQLFSPENCDASNIPPPLSEPATLELGGVIYTAILNPRDGRKNWYDVFWAFCCAFRDNPDATLVLKLTCYDPAQMIDVLLYDLYKLTPFKCRVVAIAGYLADEEYDKLAAVTTYAVNASRGEGQCLPLMEYMSGGVPAVSPTHTGLLDYINAENSFLVASSLEPSCWPHDPRLAYRTLRHRIDWESLYQAYRESYEVATREPERYHAMSQAAVTSLERHCSRRVVTETLREFLTLHRQVYNYASGALSPVSRPEQPSRPSFLSRLFSS